MQPTLRILTLFFCLVQAVLSGLAPFDQKEESTQPQVSLLTSALKSAESGTVTEKQLQKPLACMSMASVLFAVQKTQATLQAHELASTNKPDTIHESLRDTLKSTQVLRRALSRFPVEMCFVGELTDKLSEAINSLHVGSDLLKYTQEPENVIQAFIPSPIEFESKVLQGIRSTMEVFFDVLF